MIKKSFLFLILFFLLYTKYIYVKPWIYSSQHQYQDNLIKAQNFIFNTNDSLSNVILGTSLSCRLVMDSLSGFYNLSFGGLSVLDGLEILKKNNKLPKNLFIETNVVLKQENSGFTSSLFSTFSNIFKRNILSLREDKQPIPIFIKYFLNDLQNSSLNFTLINDFIGFFRGINCKEDLSNYSPINSNYNKEIFKQLLDIKIKEYSKTPNIKILTKQLIVLRDYVNYFKTRGVNVYLFEMPINYKLIKLTNYKIVSNQMYIFLPPQKYFYITSDSSLYETTDGLHLEGYEARKYSSFLKAQVMKLNN